MPPPSRHDNTDTTSAAKPTSKAASAVAPDWERIELDYRAGIKPLRQIASENGISEGAIRKRAKRDDWSRDLSVKIQTKAEELVRKDAVRSEVRTESKLPSAGCHSGIQSKRSFAQCRVRTGCIC